MMTRAEAVKLAVEKGWTITTEKIWGLRRVHMVRGEVKITASWRAENGNFRGATIEQPGRPPEHFPNPYKIRKQLTRILSEPAIEETP